MTEEMPKDKDEDLLLIPKLIVGAVVLANILMIIGVVKKSILAMVPLYLVFIALIPFAASYFSIYAMYLDHYETFTFGYLALVYWIFGPFFVVPFEIRKERAEKRRKLKARI